MQKLMKKALALASSWFEGFEATIDHERAEADARPASLEVAPAGAGFSACLGAVGFGK